MRVPLILEAANLFVGDTGDSTHLVLAELKLPNVQENYQEHQAGGARFAIEVDMFVERLDAGFILLGWQPDILRLMNREQLQTFTVYGLLRNKKTNEAQELKAIMRGRLGKADPISFTRGTLQGLEFAIRAIVYYQLIIARQEIFRFDWFENRRRFSDAMTARYQAGRQAYSDAMNWMLGP